MKNGNFRLEESSIDGLRSVIPGEPDVDYPIYRSPPDTTFTCANRADGKIIT